MIVTSRQKCRWAGLMRERPAAVPATLSAADPAPIRRAAGGPGLQTLLRRETGVGPVLCLF